jgi:hypothetical protein
MVITSRSHRGGSEFDPRHDHFSFSRYFVHLFLPMRGHRIDKERNKLKLYIVLKSELLTCYNGISPHQPHTQVVMLLLLITSPVAVSIMH